MQVPDKAAKKEELFAPQTCFPSKLGASGMTDAAHSPMEE
jgi:hypothetical protein